MKRLNLKFSRKFFVFICQITLFASCYSYAPVKTSTVINFNFNSPSKEKLSAENVILRKNKKNSGRIVYNNRYFIICSSSSPLCVINNESVKLALNGKYEESALLLEQCLTDCGDKIPLLNNLAVIYEMQGKNENSFSMYILALLEKDNYIVRNNFLSINRKIEKRNRAKIEDDNNSNLETKEHKSAER